MQSDVAAASAGDRSSFSAQFAVAPQLGASFDVGFGRLAAELRCLHATVDHGGVEGRIGGLNALAGYRVGM